VNKKFIIKNTSRAEELLESRNTTPPSISPKMAKGVSDHRREELHDQVLNGQYSDGGGRAKPMSSISDEPTLASAVRGSSEGLLKLAQGSGGGVVGKGGQGFRGSAGDTVRQGPEVYSPLWLNSNLNLPRDRATLNAWARSFFALNPIVQNAISLHSTYPISKLNIKCKNQKVEAFFQDMAEEMDLLNKCIQIAQEFWVVGEAFPYMELDERQGKWSRIIIQNPDYIVVKQSVIAGEPIISLRPDENLRRVVFSNNPVDLQQRKQLDPTIIDHVKRSENIPLNNFYISHLARKISPYEVRGTSIIVSCFRDLMLFDLLRESKFAQAYNMINPLTLVKIGGAEFKPNPTDLEAWREVFECHDEETEVLTDQGFMKFDEVIEYQEAMDGTTGMSQITWKRPKPGIKIACFNPDTEELEYHFPDAAHIYDYDGEMYHFANDKMDIKVTPNHKMWVQRKRFKGTTGKGKKRESWWGEWEAIEAKDVKLADRRFRSKINWKGNDEIKEVEIKGNKVPIELYLEFLGYLLSEGCVFNDDSHCMLTLAQTTTVKNKGANPFYPKMKKCLESFAEIFQARVGHSFRKEGETTQELWTGRLSHRNLVSFFEDEIGTGQSAKSWEKYIPRWILNLSPRLLNILLSALLAGDGSAFERPKNKSLTGYFYYSTSKQLADDVYEVAYKCDFVPTMFKRDDERYLYTYGSTKEERSTPRKTPRRVLYTVQWSNSHIGEFPLLNKNIIDPRTKIRRPLLTNPHYSGKVWCFSTPTGFMITRRNNKVTVQQQSAQYDRDFKIFTHDQVAVERVGYASGIYDTSADITQIIKEIYIGLMVPSVIMDGSDTTYATGSVALDVLRQRYLSFREMMTLWLRRKVFAPISKLQNFYEYREGKKELIIPDVDWNHMSLFDMNDYISNLINLLGTEPGKEKVSIHTVYRSLGLNYEDEDRKLRYESVQRTIRNKETEALDNYSLNELRAFGPGDEVDDRNKKVPGETSEGNDEGEAGGGGLPSMDDAPM